METPSTGKSSIYWLTNGDYKKAVGQLRLQLHGVFEPFRMYGLQDFIPGAVDEVIKLAEDFSLRCRGIDKPIDLDVVRRNVKRSK